MTQFVVAILFLAFAADHTPERVARYERTEFADRVDAFAAAYNAWCNFRNQIEQGQITDFKHAKEAELWRKVMAEFRRLETSPGTPEAK